MNDQPHILVLEDDPDMRDMLATILSDEGYQVTAVERGEQAVEAATRQAFDLIVADIRMDGMDGLTAVEQTREMQPEIGTLVVTGYAVPEDAARADRMKLGGFLRKPFRAKELLELVRREVGGGRRQERQRVQGAGTRRLFLWALESLGRVLDEARSNCETDSPRVGRAAELARRLAERRGFSPEVCEEVGLGAVWLALQESDSTRLPEGLQGALAEYPVLALLARRQDAPEAELARLAWAAARSGPEFPSAAQLSGEASPTALELYQEVVTKSGRPEPVTTPPATRVGGSLLNLALTLEQAGDLPSADRAFSEVTRAGASREGVLALRGRSRLALAAGDSQQAAELARRSVEMADLLGPTAAAQGRLEAGVLLLGNQPSLAADLLAQAVDGMEQLQLDAGAARARIALATVEPTRARGPEFEAALRTLSDLHHHAEVAASVHWLVPGLLSLAADADGESLLHRQLARLAIDFPGGFLEALLQGRLKAPARLRLVAALARAGPMASPEVLDILRQDPDPEVRQAAYAVQDEAGLSESSAPVLRVHSFGYFTVCRGDQTISEQSWKTRKARYLFAFLASNWGKPIYEERLLTEFWPENLERGKQNLYWATSAVRRCLRRDEGDETPIIVREGETLSLNPTLPHWHDLQEFEQALEAAARADQAGQERDAIRHYRRVSELYQGPYLDGCYLDWALTRRDTLDLGLGEALTRMATLSYQARAYTEVLEAARRALELSPQRQDAHLLMMKAYLGLGQPELAMKQYRDCERLLRMEYELEPNIPLLECYHRARLGLGPE